MAIDGWSSCDCRGIRCFSFVSQKDYVVRKTDGLARNMLNVYLLGAGVYSNLIDQEYMTPLTAKNKRKRIERI